MFLSGRTDLGWKLAFVECLPCNQAKLFSLCYDVHFTDEQKKFKKVNNLTTVSLDRREN